MEPGTVFKPYGPGAAVLVKYECESASVAEMRSAGSNFSSFPRRSRASGDAFGMTVENGAGLQAGNGLSWISGESFAIL